MNSFLDDGPSVPGSILRRQTGIRFGIESILVKGLALEGVEQTIELLSIKDEAGALVHGREVWSPLRVKRAALDADVGHRFCVGQAPFHAGRALTIC